MIDVINMMVLHERKIGHPDSLKVVPEQVWAQIQRLVNLADVDHWKETVAFIEEEWGYSYDEALTLYDAAGALRQECEYKEQREYTLRTVQVRRKPACSNKDLDADAKPIDLNLGF